MKTVFKIIGAIALVMIISGYWLAIFELIPITVIAIIANIIIENRNKINRQNQAEQAQRDIDELEREFREREKSI